METSVRNPWFTCDVTLRSDLRRRNEAKKLSPSERSRFDRLRVDAHKRILEAIPGRLSSAPSERLNKTLSKGEELESQWVASGPPKLNPETLELPPFAKELVSLVKDGHYQKTLEYYHQIQREGVTPDKFCFVPVLKACARLRALKEGRQIHMQIISSGCELDMFVGSSLVDMYAKCGRIEDAQKLFNKMPKKDVVSWNTMIIGHVKCGQGPKALKLYEKMEMQQVYPDTFTFVSVLSACTSMGDLEEGRRVHDDFIWSGCGYSVYVSNSLIDMYAKCGSIEDAETVFNEMQTRNAVSWSTMLTGYVKCGRGTAALDLYLQMQFERVHLGPATFIAVLKACAIVGAIDEGRRVHTQVIQSGCESDPFVSSCLVEMYAKCGSMGEAEEVFSHIRTQNLVSWNVMIASYVKSGQGWKALELYHQMHLEQMKPGTATFVVVLNACVTIGALEEGRLVHAHIIESGCESDVHVCTSLVDMYAKCGSIEEARGLFDRMRTRNVVSWNVMIQGHLKCGEEQMALDLFDKMLTEHIKPDTATFVGVLNACASLGALEEGRRVHSKIIQCGCESNMFVGSSLIDMYAKCGSIESAQRLFNTMIERDAVCWNVMLRGYAVHGYIKEAFALFEQMSKEGVEIGGVTYISLLSACSHAGLVEEGLEYFRSMTAVHGVSPTRDHYACMADLLGRAGRLQEAENLIKSMPFKPDVIVWMALLGGCRVHGNMEIGERVAKKILEMDPTNDAAYVVLSNIYAADEGDSSKNYQQIRIKSGVKKELRCAWIEVNNELNSFVVDDQTHPQIKETQKELERLFREMTDAGYIPDTHFVLDDVDEEEKVSCLQYHSEKLAIAFGLINTAPGSPLHIITNSGICGDCHSAFKFISKITRRSIIVRDVNCFHHFRDGLCNCTDYQ